MPSSKVFYKVQFTYRIQSFTHKERAYHKISNC